MKVRGKINETILASILSKISALHKDKLQALIILIFSGGISDRPKPIPTNPLPEFLALPKEAAILLVLKVLPERH